jgi:hypothetical protein
MKANVSSSTLHQTSVPSTRFGRLLSRPMQKTTKAWVRWGTRVTIRPILPLATLVRSPSIRDTFKRTSIPKNRKSSLLTTKHTNPICPHRLDISLMSKSASRTLLRTRISSISISTPHLRRRRNRNLNIGTTLTKRVNSFSTNSSLTEFNWINAVD